MLGVALMELGETAAAETALRQALSIAPQDADVHYNLARLLERTARGAEARGHMDAVRRIEASSK
jgi:Flp pilus assembly protein TadD